MQSGKTKTEVIEDVRLGDVVADYSYQVRKEINKHVTNQYADSMRSGQQFPPLILEQGTNKIVCGFTRYAAYQKAFDPDHMIPAITKIFKSDLERVYYATEDNHAHGERLTTFDIQNILAHIKRLGGKEEIAAEKLGMSLGKIRILAGRGFEVVGTTPAFVETRFDGQKTKVPMIEVVSEDNKQISVQPAKSGNVHLIGKRISKAVYDNICAHYLGYTATVLINQIIMRIDDKTLNYENEVETRRLRVLYEKLKEMFEPETS